MRTRVTAVGESTSLSDRKRRAGQRLFLGLAQPRLDGDTRALLRELQPAGFLVDPRGAEEPAQLRELSRELAAQLAAARPPLILARHHRGAPCPGGTDWPAPGWLARGDDPALTFRVGQAWRAELGALGFHLHLAPICDLELLNGEPVPGLGDDCGDLLLGPSVSQATESLRAFLGGAAAASSCPACFTGFVDSVGRLLALEKELPGLLAEDLEPVRTAIDAAVPALLVGHGRWSAFHEDRPCGQLPRLLRDVVRQELGFRGLLLGEDLSVHASRERSSLDGQLHDGLEASVDAWLVSGSPAGQMRVFEALVRMQEERPSLDPLFRDSDIRLLKTREALLLHRHAAELELVGCAASRDLALLARARGG